MLQIEIKTGRGFAIVAVAVASLTLLHGCSGTSTPPQQKAVLVSKECWIDGINGDPATTVRLPPGDISIGGWAVDITSGTAPEIVTVQLLDAKGDSFVMQKSDKPISRLDVAQVKNQPAFEKSGFAVVINGKGLLPGEYGLSLAMHRPGADLVCPSSKRLVIKQ
jgi:hypothetical protein